MTEQTPNVALIEEVNEVLNTILGELHNIEAEANRIKRFHADPGQDSPRDAASIQARRQHCHVLVVGLRDKFAASERALRAAEQRVEWIASAFAGDAIFGAACTDSLFQQAVQLKHELAQLRAEREARDEAGKKMRRICDCVQAAVISAYGFHGEQVINAAVDRANAEHERAQLADAGGAGADNNG